MRRGAALYRSGDFAAAAEVYARLDTAAGQFNRGNALVLQGEYAQAIEAYERSLRRRPGWQEARDNLEIARLRAARLQTEGGDMTGGRLEADEIVFDAGSPGSDEAPDPDTAGALDDQTLQALWLRRVQTRPEDFLRARFAFQLARAETTP